MKKFLIGLLFSTLYLNSKIDITFDDAPKAGLMSQQQLPPIPDSQQPLPPMPLAQQRVLPTPSSQTELPPIPDSQQPLPLPQPPQEIIYQTPIVKETIVTPAVSEQPELPALATIVEQPLEITQQAPVVELPAVLPEAERTKDTHIAVISPAVEHPEKIASEPEARTKTSKRKKQTKKPQEPYVSFDFKDEKLINIINLIAAKKGINIVLPQGNDAIKTTISFKQTGKIPLSQAEKYLSLFLEMSGYTMYPTDGFFVISKKADNTAGREPVNLYVGVPPNELPQNSETIRAIYYLINFQVPPTNQGTEPISVILTEMLGAKKFMYDQKSNAIILYGPADKIASVMTIILELDAAGSPEVVEVFPLFYSSADTVAKLIQGQISAVTKSPQTGARVQASTESGSYFAPNTRAIADTRTNSIVLMGREAAVSRIKSFVREYIDVPAESGKSILHLYDLQYLDSKSFADVLKKIVAQNITGQSEKDSSAGAYRFFEGVNIIAEEETPDDIAKDVATSSGASAVQGAKGKVSFGGNRLIVTAKNDDWVLIKELIEELDKPELQVIIEIMILDVTLRGAKSLEMQARNPLNINLHDSSNVQFQSAQIVEPILDPNNTNPTTLAGDLLRLLGLIPNDRSIAVNETSGTSSGTTIISFKDPCSDKIWALLSILDKWITTKIISHPFLVTKNNVKAKERLTTIRQGDGREVASGGVATVKIEDFKAELAVEVTPRISSLDRLNLQIRIDIDNFLTNVPTDFTRATRSVETNATLSTGQILILGGLTQEADTESESKVPILGDIPIFGYLFKSTVKSKIKNNLAIFIQPTIIEPKLRSGQNRYTDDRIQLEKKRLEAENLFSTNKDPIVRMFFNNMGKSGPETLDEYLKETHYGELQTQESFNPVELTEEEARVILPGVLPPQVAA